MARLWLTVHEHNDWPSSSQYELWWRDTTFEHAPDPGEMVMFLASEEEPDGSVTIEVRDRWWDINGRLNLQLRKIVHLPDEDQEERITGSVQHGWTHAEYVRKMPVPWRAADDELSGPLNDRLQASGWRPYSQERPDA